MANLAIHHDNGFHNFERREITKKVQDGERQQIVTAIAAPTDTATTAKRN
tara:strand:+ start:346 stop:495 length:150 start_codon:yes stop_codon:yes gene_type:complete